LAQGYLWDIMMFEGGVRAAMKILEFRAVAMITLKIENNSQRDFDFMVLTANVSQSFWKTAVLEK
jgi:hypothetical protein